MTRTIAVIGCAHPHLADYLRAVAAHPGVHVSHVWDRDAERARRVAQPLGARVAEPAPGHAAPDACLVLSETRHHHDDARAALRLHRPVFIEKPLSFGAVAIDSLADAVAASGVAFHTGFFLRTVPSMRALRDWVRAGRFGRIGLARMRFGHDGARAGWLDASGWLGRLGDAGYGGFGDLAIHGVDLLAWLGLGPLQPVAAKRVRMSGMGEGDDFGSAILRSADDGIVVVEAGWMDRALPVLELEILGSAGWARTVGGRLHAVGQAPGDGGGTDLGAVAPDAASGLQSFLALLTQGDGGGLVSIAEARTANLLIDELYRIAEFSGP